MRNARRRREQQHMPMTDTTSKLGADMLNDDEREAIKSGIAAMEKCGWTHRVPVLRDLLARQPAAIGKEPLFYADDEQIADWEQGKRGAVDVRVTSIALGSCNTPLYAAPLDKEADQQSDAASDLAFSVYSGINALRWLLNITTEFDRKDVRTRQAARLLDEYTDSFGKTNRERLEAMWKALNDSLPDDGRINEYLRAHDAAGRALKAKGSSK
jgi:hypothetical protein